MSNWTHYYDCLEPSPIKGDEEQFRTTAAAVTDVGDVVGTVAREFKRVKEADSLSEIRGQTADQLVNLIASIDASIEDLPPLFDSLADVLNQHARQLEDLKEEASSALARAETHWHSRDSANRDCESARRWRADIEAALDRASAAGNHSEVSFYCDQRHWANRKLSEAENRQAAANEGLADMKRTFFDLQNAERKLNEKTGDAIRDLDLGDLKDPGRFSSFLNMAGDFLKSISVDLVVDLVENFTALLGAIADLDFGDFLWRLSEFLGTLLAALAVVAVIAAVVASGGTALAVAGLVLGGAKLLTDIGLAAGGHPHPETGEKMSWEYVIAEAGLFALSAGTLKATSFGDKVASKWFGSLRASPSTQRVVTRVANSSKIGNRAVNVAKEYGERTVGAGIDYGVDRFNGYVHEQLRSNQLNTDLSGDDRSGLLDEGFVDFAAESPLTAGVAALETDCRAINSVPRIGVDGSADSPRYVVAPPNAQPPVSTTVPKETFVLRPDDIPEPTGPIAPTRQSTTPNSGDR